MKLGRGTLDCKVKILKATLVLIFPKCQSANFLCASDWVRQDFVTTSFDKAKISRNVVDSSMVYVCK